MARIGNRSILMSILLWPYRLTVRTSTYSGSTPFGFLRRNHKRSCGVAPIIMGSQIATPHPFRALSVWFLSLCVCARLKIAKWPYRLTVRTAPFHGVNRGSIPRGVTSDTKRSLQSVLCYLAAEVIFCQQAKYIHHHCKLLEWRDDKG